VLDSGLNRFALAPFDKSKRAGMPISYAMARRVAPMVDVVGSETYLGCMQREAAAGDAVHLAGTAIADSESRGCSELRLVGEP
jgi:hypothetical protein